MESSVRGRVGGGGAGAEVLPLPPPPRLAAISSYPASIRALLARTASGPGVGDCQSPRSLLSRILQRGDGGNGGFGFRVRLPRRYSSSGGGREERKDDAEQAAATPRVKVVERAPGLPIETPQSSLGKKKPEEKLMSMNLGLGASLVLLLSKSAVELNKMVELRAQVEALVREIRKETTHRKEKDSASSSSHESNGSNTATTAVIKDPIACAAAEDALSNCSRTANCAVRDNPLRGRTVVAMDQMEAELQVELNSLQCAAHGEKRIAPMQALELPLLQVKTQSNASDSPARSCVDDGGGVKDDDVAEGNAEEEVDDDEEEEEYEEPEDEELQGRNDVEKSPPHGGVSARALERRLHELLQKRQQERIVELESALHSAQRRLHEKEREVVWWRDAAKLVSHRRDESRRLR